jgi:hypothetical protein
VPPSLLCSASPPVYAALLTKGLSRRSVEQTHTVLHRALRQAVLWGLMLRNPTEAVTVPRPIRREMQTLTEEEVGASSRAAKIIACTRSGFCWRPPASASVKLWGFFGPTSTSRTADWS